MPAQCSYQVAFKLMRHRALCPSALPSAHKGLYYFRMLASRTFLNATWYQSSSSILFLSPQSSALSPDS